MNGAEPGRQLTTGGLGLRIALYIAIGIPLVAVVWEALNELLAGRVVPRHLLVAVPGLLALWFFFRLLGRSIQQWDRQDQPDHPQAPRP